MIMKPIKNDGVVSSFFTYTGPSDGTRWDEIDIEFLGKNTTQVQFNYYTNGVGNHEYLYNLGFDVTLRLSPFLFETADFDKINSIEVDKCLVEFLRTKPSLEKELSDFITFNDYSLKDGGYRHLTLQKKLEILSKLKFKELTVCDDVQSHYDYFQNNINYNPSDCCNLNN